MEISTLKHAPQKKKSMTKLDQPEMHDAGDGIYHKLQSNSWMSNPAI